jgi:hypothetical protein
MFRPRRVRQTQVSAEGGGKETASRGLELLYRARALVERGWCQGADARNGDGAAVEAWDPGAESWSLLGAIVAVLEHEAAASGEIALDELAAALDALAAVIETDSLANWNDSGTRTRTEVLAVLDTAATAYRPPLAITSTSPN